MPKNNKKPISKETTDHKSYIQGLQLKGFRGYLNHADIKFGKRLTLIFGKGSSGKSTILEAIKCLSASNINDVDLAGIKTKHILSKQNKSKSFQLGLSAGEEDFSRGILKTFNVADSGSFYPSKVDLFSFSEKTKEGKLLANNLFASIKNEKMSKELENSLGLHNLYLSKISFAENEYAYKELFEHYSKFRKQLISNLEKTIEFTDRMADFYKKADENSLSIKKNRKKIEEIKKRLDEPNEKLSSIEKRKVKIELDKLSNEVKRVNSEIEKLESERDDLFAEAMDSNTFSPTRYLFRTRNTVINHIKLLKNKNINLKQFIQYLSNDLKIEKQYLYKNNRLLGREIRRSLNKSLTPEERKIFNDFTTLLEFLCYELSSMILGYNRKNLGFVPSKNHFQWSLEEPGKTLNVKAMFDSCSRVFSSVLEKIKIIRHVEMQQMLANQFSQINLINPHALIEDNQKKINKWLEIFEYDFKVSVERSGLNDETEIVHKKGGHKIPASQGGSGAQYLLTFLSACLGYRDDILLIEEPEKGLHPSLQVKLSKFFVENSGTNQLIIETHSENLLLGILKSIRDKELNPEDIVINYVYMENGESKVDELKVDNKGNFLSKWRHGFFTERLDLL